MSLLSAAASDEDGDTIKALRAAIEQARDWIAEHPDRRPISAGRMVAILTNALAAAPQRQDHTAQHLNMVPEGWALVPVEPTNEMVQAWLDTYEGNIQTVYRAMLAAAPQPPVVEQPQVEQEPVATVSIVIDGSRTMIDMEWNDRLAELPAGNHRLYTHPQNLNCKSAQARLATLWGYEKPQPPRQPLTDEQIDALAVDDDLLPLSHLEFARAVERAVWEKSNG